MLSRTKGVRPSVTMRAIESRNRGLWRMNQSEVVPSPKLKVLMVHNAYQQRGGEDSVVESEAALLRQHGHEVFMYERHNDEVNETPRWQLAVQTLWSSKTTREIEALIAQVKPDVMHVHNTMPLVSPSVYWAARKMGVPVVQTLHNFRLLCPQAMFVREGRVCEDCLGKVPWRGVVHRCYRDSALQSGFWERSRPKSTNTLP